VSQDFSVSSYCTDDFSAMSDIRSAPIASDAKLNVISRETLASSAAHQPRRMDMVT
jgi:hypothetical protein